jgi:hypothetical protein
MENNYNPTSYTKGEAFENFVERILFPSSHYELLHKTQGISQNSNRYVRSSLKPDFQFKCRTTGKVFYIEAKFRSKTFNDNYEVLSEQQNKSFPHLNNPSSPIYIAFGYGGKAESPNYISLIPLEAVNSRALRPEKIAEYDINKEIYPHTSFDSKSQVEQKVVVDLPNDIPVHKASRPKLSIKNYDLKILIAACIGVFAILFTFYAFNFSEPNVTPEEQLKEIIADYYQSMNSNQVEKLPVFLSSDVKSWYGDKEVNLNEIMINARAHRGKFPFSTSDINWDSFKLVRLSDGNYFVSYEMIYKSKQKIMDNYNVFNLKLLTEWDSDLKLNSITEIRR